ncbi:hypothetical protein [Roseiflexus castenholzii]|uniref:Uncharacterized protein n=1 Tax=Roseiflexus castenholzii (strain DSM 13941 / HLO8) TaxID=383372 RepID=A7NI23_ROSCS|nr:hypothetical protein [Roseiflexus castenholzii]ABU57123.1 hypothetical protein Rcas_1015 [Roseiflexus castenholzii DSM 13941]
MKVDAQARPSRLRIRGNLAHHGIVGNADLGHKHTTIAGDKAFLYETDERVVGKSTPQAEAPVRLARIIGARQETPNAMGLGPLERQHWDGKGFDRVAKHGR